jgi:hypothetical protein
MTEFEKLKVKTREAYAAELKIQRRFRERRIGGVSMADVIKVENKVRRAEKKLERAFRMLSAREQSDIARELINS